MKLTIKDHVDNWKKEFPSLTDFEALQLTLQQERNEILKKVFVLHPDDAHPSALEAICIQLGATRNNFKPSTILDELKDLKEIMESIARRMDK